MKSNSGTVTKRKRSRTAALDRTSHKVPEPENKRTCILVLGMHRSGTSALTRAIGLMGAELPRNLLGSNSSNETGHWEPAKLVGLHDQLLHEAGSRWDDWRKLELPRLSDKRRDFFTSEIVRIITDEYANAPLIVLKEPRISRFVPFYQDVLGSINFDVQFVFSTRNPASVAASLKERDHMSAGYAALVWLRHELDAEYATRSSPRVFVSYEYLLEDSQTALASVCRQLGPQWKKQDRKLHREIDSFLSEKHQHHHADIEKLATKPGISAWVKDTYAALCTLESNPYEKSAMKRLDKVRNEFDAAAGIVGDVLFEEICARQNRVTNTRNELVKQQENWNAERARLTGKIDTFRRELAQSRNDLESALIEVEEQQNRASMKIELLKQDLQEARTDSRIALEKMRDDYDRVLADKDRNIADLEHRALDTLAGQEGARVENERLRGVIEEIYSSNSWRLTGPVRWLKTGAMKIFSKISS